MSIFWSGPLVGVIMSLALVLLLWPLVPMLRERLSDSRGGIKA